MLITLDFLTNKELEGTELEIQKKAIEAIYQDFFQFYKSEKEFWVAEIIAGFEQNVLTKKLSKKRKQSMAQQVWINTNIKNIKDAFNVEDIFDGYEKIEYIEETDSFDIVRKPDDDEDEQTAEVTEEIAEETILNDSVENIQQP